MNKQDGETFVFIVKSVKYCSQVNSFSKMLHTGLEMDCYSLATVPCLFQMLVANQYLYLAQGMN